MSARRNLLYMGIYENAQTLSASDPTTLHTSEVPSSIDANGSRQLQVLDFFKVLRGTGCQVSRCNSPSDLFPPVYSISTSFVQNVCLFQIEK